MKCEISWHNGNRTVYRMKAFYRDGQRYEGCVQCIEPMLTNLYSTEKRWVTSAGTGKQYKISAAHVHDIKTRRCDPNLSGVWRDKKGLGSNMRY